MIHLLKRPIYSIENYYEDMLKGRHDNEKNNFLKTRLLSIKSKLIDEENTYQYLAEKKELYTISELDTISIPTIKELGDSIPKTINAAEMEKVYTNFLVDKQDSKKIGRKVYDSILSNTYYNLCPYCSHREAKTVDHYLPKSKFIHFAVTPINLVPCCSDCNKDKLDDYNLIEEKMLIHPYFDEISLIDWLKCEVNEKIWPITFSYQVSNTITDSVLKSRINYQFKLLNLGKLYADNAAREFNKRVKSLVKEYNSNPSDKAMDFLNDNYESYYSENTNSWQTKMFEALKSSRWFIGEALPNLQSFYNKI
ncbi:HNH endonuclease signature motif containing protein [Halalkalibacterium halodurans]|uniref:HNH endonuclease n=1 Tax=Halalkalibacterium halodurans TaxID=86665 RepID=UPI002E1A56E6|nr:HNH endonuclease signature motif containing protein [Halalkalibacterium halodurans]